MPHNSRPLFTGVPFIWVAATNPLITAANDTNGVSANNVLFNTPAGATATAEATYGSFISFVRFKAVGANAATVARLYLNNGSAPTTAANNIFIADITLSASTASAAAAQIDYDLYLNRPIPPGARLLVGLGTAGTAGWTVSAFGGHYSATA